jgi:hypothetical protein
MANEQQTETVEPRDLASEMPAVMKDLLSGKSLRHSITPAVSDFTNATAAAVPPADTLSILTNWQAQGIVFSKIPNDNYGVDGVQYLWKLNWNGVQSVKGTPAAPVATLTSIAPTTGVHATQVAVTATGTEFDTDSVISVDGGATVGLTTFVNETSLTAEVTLPAAAGTVNVSVKSHLWGTTTASQPLTVT